MQEQGKGGGPLRWGAGNLMRKLAMRMRIRRPRAPRVPLAAPGERSGEGTDSLQPYLQQSRNTRPGSLE